MNCIKPASSTGTKILSDGEYAKWLAVTDVNRTDQLIASYEYIVYPGGCESAVHTSNPSPHNTIQPNSASGSLDPLVVHVCPSAERAVILGASAS